MADPDPLVGEDVDQDWLLDWSLKRPKTGYAVTQQMAGIKGENDDTELCLCVDAAHHDTQPGEYKYLDPRTYVEVYNEAGERIAYRLEDL